jgi:hypothetical protein
MPEVATSSSPEAPAQPSLTAFVRKHWLVLLLVSTLCLVPCFWHPHIEAGDLASHSYNAWLTSLIQHGRAPGLWIAPQTTNILFDILLYRFGSAFGFSIGEKFAVAVAVLVFLWGAFSLVSIVGARPAWFLLPLLVMLAHGWTAQMGFFNFYLSLGLSCVGLALLWRAQGRTFLYLLPLAALIWMAHPLGFAWFVATAIYLAAARLIRPPVQYVLPLAALAVVFLLRLYLAHRYEVLWPAIPFYRLNGSDQFVLGSRYLFLGSCVVLATAGCGLLHLVQIRRKKSQNYFPPSVQLFVVCFLGVGLLPHTMWVPRYVDPVALITSRMTLATALLGCVALSGLRPRLPFAIVTAAIALAYFGFLHQDTAKVYAMERQAQELVQKVPQNARVIASIARPRDSRLFVHHLVARACIEHCFVLNNYEAFTGQFRIRAKPGNRIVETDNQEISRMTLGDFLVKPEDLPEWQIFQCGPLEIDLCLRALQPGPARNVFPGSIIRARPHQPGG